ncbi:MAG: YdcH family protein [Limisphaerales bacterium]
MDLHHPITREFPNHLDTIKRLRSTDEHFRKAFKEYHRIDDAIYRIEEDIDFATDQEIEELKMERARLKDWLYHAILKAAPKAQPTHVPGDNLHHPIIEELPKYAGVIKHLKGTDHKFRKAYDEYHHLDDEIFRIEEGIETASDQELEEMKLRRARLKDWLFHAITHAPPVI